MLYDNESRKAELMRQADDLRAAARYISKLKDIIQSYDGKVYNKRLNEALETVTDDFYVIRAYKNSFGYFELEINPKHNPYKGRLNMLYIKVNKYPSHYLTEDKRIIATEWIQDLNNKYAEFLKKATEIEESAQNMEQILDQIDQLKSALHTITNNLPNSFIDVCGIKRYY